MRLKTPPSFRDDGNPGPRLRPAARDGDLAREVRRQFEALSDHVPTLGEVARRLAVSERTLRRRLQVQNTSYSELLQEVRRERAETALAQSDLTVDEIAARLGYTETTNFRHAFRRWLGVSPHAFRLQIRRISRVAGQAA